LIFPAPHNSNIQISDIGDFHFFFFLPANILADELLCGKQQKKRFAEKKEEWMRMLEYSFICSQQQSYNTTSYPIPRRNMQPKTPTAVDLCVCVGVHCKKNMTQAILIALFIRHCNCISLFQFYRLISFIFPISLLVIKMKMSLYPFT